MKHRSVSVDRLLRRASLAAEGSRLWLGVACAMAACGGGRGRRAAARGVVAIALASSLVNGPLKISTRRPRPPLAPTTRRLIGVPASWSFPSGHAASAFAFATAAAREAPALALPLGGAAAAVAYSRVHTGVHYPSDVAAGAGIGVCAALVAGRLLRAVEGRAPLRRRAPIDNAVPRRAVLLASPHAGAARSLEKVRQVMSANGFEILDEIAIEHRDRLEGWISQPGDERPLIVAAGGDGTVGAAADQVAGTDAVLAVLPLGTSNDFARSLGIPTNPAHAANLLATGNVSTIDAGRLIVSGEPVRHFVHAATAGLNVSFARLATRASLRERFGRLTYAVAGMMALREHESFGCELSYDSGSERLDLVHLSIINAPVFGGFLGMRVRGSSLDDRVLDVIAVQRLSMWRLIAAALHPIVGIRRPVRGIRTLHVGRLRVHTTQQLEVALDGEIVGRLPADFEVVGEALRVVTAPEFEDVDD